MAKRTRLARRDDASVFINPSDVSWLEPIELPNDEGWNTLVHLKSGGSVEVRGSPIVVDRKLSE